MENSNLFRDNLLVKISFQKLSIFVRKFYLKVINNIKALVFILF